MMNAKVFIVQEFEATTSAILHVNVHVHSTGTQQGRVKPVLVVGSEHNNSLVAVTGPQAVNDV